MNRYFLTSFEWNTRHTEQKEPRKVGQEVIALLRAKYHVIFYSAEQERLIADDINAINNPSPEKEEK